MKTHRFCSCDRALGLSWGVQTESTDHWISTIWDDFKEAVDCKLPGMNTLDDSSPLGPAI